MSIKVREAQYGIAIREYTSCELDTASLQTCVAFAGVNREKGIGFLCHLNSPKCASKLLPELIKDLRHAGLNLHDFKLYTASGLNTWPWIFVVTALSAGLLQNIFALCKQPVASWMLYTVGACIAAGYFFSKRIGLWFALRRLGASAIERKFIGYAYCGTVGRSRGRVLVDISKQGEEEPKLRHYKAEKLESTYAPPSDKNDKRAACSATQVQLEALLTASVN